MTKLEQIESVVTIAAIIIGGFSAYYRFFKGRIFAPRLDPRLTGRVVRQNDRFFLVVALNVRNVGSTKINLLQEGTCLLVHLLKPPNQLENRATTIPQTYVGAFSVLGKHKWIESGRTVQEELLLALPPFQDSVAVQLKCRVIFRNVTRLLKNIDNTITAIITIDTKENPNK